MDRPCRMGRPLLDQILVMGQLQLTTQLIRACLRRGIPIASPWCSTAPTNSSRSWCQGRPLRPLVAVIMRITEMSLDTARLRWRGPPG
jgi:hypothetical protein